MTMIFVRNGKLVKYAQQKGFQPELSWKVINGEHINYTTKNREDYMFTTEGRNDIKKRLDALRGYL